MFSTFGLNRLFGDSRLSKAILMSGCTITTLLVAYYLFNKNKCSVLILDNSLYRYMFLTEDINKYVNLLEKLKIVDDNLKKDLEFIETKYIVLVLNNNSNLINKCLYKEIKDSLVEMNSELDFIFSTIDSINISEINSNSYRMDLIKQNRKRLVDNFKQYAEKVDKLFVDISRLQF